MARYDDQPGERFRDRGENNYATRQQDQYQDYSGQFDEAGLNQFEDRGSSSDWRYQEDNRRNEQYGRGDRWRQRDNGAMDDYDGGYRRRGTEAAGPVGSRSRGGPGRGSVNDRFPQGGYGSSGSGYRGHGYPEHRDMYDHERSQGYGSYDDYGTGRRNGGHDRGFFERAGDEIASWFGDEDAERRRRQDHRGRGPANYQRSNERLLEDACERLTHSPRVDASNINVSAEDNEITLDGTVDSRMAKRCAEDCVHDISGVTHVQNNLRIQREDSDTYRSEKTS